MAEYNEFRILLTPNLQNPGQWVAQILECPLIAFKNLTETITPTFTRAHLRRLRNPHSWPDSDEMETIGHQVWQSVIATRFEQVFDACLQASINLNRRMRIRLVIKGQGEEAAGLDRITLSELPVEALCQRTDKFVATDLITPVSRGLAEDPDRDPFTVPYPLRMLVVVATPEDMPPADAPAEARAIREALSPLTGSGGPVELEFCEPPTREELLKRLTKPHHILHFVGHGGFDSLGDDLNPQPFIILSRPDRSNPARLISDKISARDLAVSLQNTSIKLAVFTACQSAAPTPADGATPPPVNDDHPYRVSAYEGIAQRLLGGVSDITAAVAMQFDIESEAAVIFTRSFYENLLYQEKDLDEVVTLARKALATHPNFGIGHRAWLTPTVYWRCKGGKVFEINSFNRRLSDEELRKIQDLESQIAVLKRHLGRIAIQPQSEREKLEPLKKEWEAEIDALQTQLAEWLGESIRLYGGRAKAQEEVTCRLTLRARLPGVIEQVMLSVHFDESKLQFVGASAGQDASHTLVFTTLIAPGQIKVLVPNPSNGISWSPKQYEIGLLKFRLAAGLQPEILDLLVKNPEIRRDNQTVANVKPLDAVLFVDSGP
ncbi:MAG TPA: CHAT domain-containing protein [Blastocatellia bacterium]|nr:CHAT domain-containing protein [Blastocatellia bacterium]